MTWGDKLDFLYDLQDSGIEVPALDNEPILIEYLIHTYTGFMRLSLTRQVSMGGPLPIQYSEILAFLQLVPYYDVEDFLYHIRAMDAVFLQHSANVKKDGESETNT